MLTVTMSGKQALRKLPPLAGWERLPAHANRTAAATELLRRIATRLRRERNIPFYTMREVAARLDMSLADVARVYHELDREGLLLVRRSAPTLLTPSEAKPRRAIRGVVALPVWQYANANWTDWRQFFSAIGDALRAKHFAADFLLYGSENLARPGFTRNILAKLPDYLLWFGMPGGGDDIMLTLHDAGIRLIVVTIGPTRLPAAHYVLQWEDGLKRALARYVREGIKRLVVLAPTEYELEQWLRDWLDNGWLPYTVVRAPLGRPRAYHRYLDRLPRRHDTVIFSPIEDWFSRLAGIEPLHLSHLLATRRWLTLHRLNLPRALVAESRAEVVAHDWPAVAAKIAEDMANHQLPAPDEPRYIQARYHPRAPAVEFAQEF
jgi:hypothetical protein